MRGFTLLELMIVVSIIAVLTTILLPVLARAKEITRNAVCKVNIRHLALANHMYAEENNEFFVLAAEDITSGNRGLKRWHGVRETPNEPFNAYKGPMGKYLPDGGIKECPSFRDFITSPGMSAAFEAGSGGYGYNDTYIGGRSDVYPYKEASKHSARITDPGSPGETVMFTDAAMIKPSGLIEYSFCHPPYWVLPGMPPNTMTSDAVIHFRHLGGCNVAWADSHVSEERLSFSFDSKTVAGMTAEAAKEKGFGWFGPQSNELFDLE